MTVRPLEREGRELSAQERRAAIRKGFGDFQVYGWAKDPPYPNGDPRLWYWHNGADAAFDYHRGRGHGRLEKVAGWA